MAQTVYATAEKAAAAWLKLAVAGKVAGWTAGRQVRGTGWWITEQNVAGYSDGRTFSTAKYANLAWFLGHAGLVAKVEGGYQVVAR